MRCKAGLGFWVVLNLATMVHAQQVASPSFIAKAFANQAPRDSANQEPKEENSKKEDKPTSIQVQGKVVNRDGQAVPHAEVTITGPKGATKTTDSTGSFTFEGPTGKYTITAKADGKSKSISEELANNKVLKLILD